MFCPKCGTNLKDGAAFCAKCGAQLTQQKKPVQNADNDSTKPNGMGGKTAVPLQVIIGIVCMVIGAGLALYGTHLNSDMEAVWNSVWQNGKTNPGSMFITFGVIIAVAGLVAIILKKKK